MHFIHVIHMHAKTLKYKPTETHTYIHTHTHNSLFLTHIHTRRRTDRLIHRQKKGRQTLLTAHLGRPVAGIADRTSGNLFFILAASNLTGSTASITLSCIFRTGFDSLSCCR